MGFKLSTNQRMSEFRDGFSNCKFPGHVFIVVPKIADYDELHFYEEYLHQERYLHQEVYDTLNNKTFQ